MKNPKNVDNVVNSIKPLPLPTAKALLNIHNNPRPPVDCYRNNLTKSSRADQDVVSDEIIHLYDRTT